MHSVYTVQIVPLSAEVEDYFLPFDMPAGVEKCLDFVGTHSDGNILGESS